LSGWVSAQTKPSFPWKSCSPPFRGGQTFYLHTVWRDISQRKKPKLDRSKAKALLSQTEILTSILNDMGDAVIVTDKQYRFLMFNPAAEQMFGTSAKRRRPGMVAHLVSIAGSDYPFPRRRLPLPRNPRGEST
jgi:PAS domain-containing protein